MCSAVFVGNGGVAARLPAPGGVLRYTAVCSGGLDGGFEATPSDFSWRVACVIEHDPRAGYTSSRVACRRGRPQVYRRYPCPPYSKQLFCFVLVWMAISSSSPAWPPIAGFSDIHRAKSCLPPPSPPHRDTSPSPFLIDAVTIYFDHDWRG